MQLTKNIAKHLKKHLIQAAKFTRKSLIWNLSLPLQRDFLGCVLSFCAAGLSFGECPIILFSSTFTHLVVIWGVPHLCPSLAPVGALEFHLSQWGRMTFALHFPSLELGVCRDWCSHRPWVLWIGTHIVPTLRLDMVFLHLAPGFELSASRSGTGAHIAPFCASF